MLLNNGAGTTSSADTFLCLICSSTLNFYPFENWWKQ
jgi:hypothetical protein